MRQRSHWYGFRTLAVDGSDLVVPDYPENRNTFGIHTNSSDVGLAMVKLSFLYDTTVDMPTDVQLSGKHASERDLAVSHLAQTQSNDLILYNRGYYAYRFDLKHQLQNRDFCFRLRANANTQVKDFIASKKRQAIIILNVTKGMQQNTLEKELKIVPLEVRLIRIKTPKGSYILMASLTDKKRYPAKDFYDLHICGGGLKSVTKNKRPF